ncbi:2-phospho-L-lactate transferase [Paraburkholderia sp. BCC1884]|uniref:2-phospho-L-lactate transferase n=1 Tax=Paraburkholderia sp. BCC1884 TaxID=2562668 RepID=UPI001183A87F|nr:2-phospho-L-lactate transferase [Paraburkholderia sp. BCC1884]
MFKREPKVVLLAGGVGGARMARGLVGSLPAGSLSVVVNIGDDEHFHGLTVCPDVDTVTYTLGGLIHAQQGWGVAGDTANALGMLRKLGASNTWMHLGDADIGVHLFRAQCLASGETLTAVTARITHALNVQATILPASDDPAPTLVDTDQGVMRFQQWFVRHRAQPTVRALRYVTEQARVSPAVAAALAEADLVVIAPSNPLLSIYPMLKLPGFSEALKTTRAKHIAVSPLIGGKAVKGPLAQMLVDLRVGSGNEAVARLYGDLLDGFVIDEADARDVSVVTAAGVPQVIVGATRMDDRQKATQLARTVLQAGGLRQEHLAPEEV